ncbi:DUF262 domain-containing protein [Peribacillus frigoritolerans]|uniref:DUF262 domain-containing protein n=1 Tax=Peribacillus frigoritolerans TaxID=450367 RepID=UPI002E1B538D|nr:DUF262 domain-containing protein [Peribacillus frigoritolerans]
MDTTKKINKLFLENSEGKLVLPNFQRGFEWKVEEQKKLLSSVLALLPIGSILLLEGQKNDFATRQLCYNDDEFEQNDECLYLLDGQQRTSTLRAIFSNLLGNKSDWEEKYDKLYKGLRYRWFVDVKKLDSEDIFGYENLMFESIIQYEPGQLYENIVEKKITKQNKSDWFHPHFHKDELGTPLTGHRLKNEIAKRASEEGLIPLYDIFNAVNNREKSLLEYTLERLANERVIRLQSDVKDGHKSIVELLGQVFPEIEDLSASEVGYEESIRFAWSTLATDWKKDMFNYLKGVLDQEMHVIQLPANEISRATAIYESINKGGVSLNTYDLIVAKAARIRTERTVTQKIIEELQGEIRLSESLLDTIKGPVESTWSSVNMGTVEDNKLANPIRDQYLNLLSIFSHTNYGNFEGFRIELIKKEKQLEIRPEKIHENTDFTIKALIRACAFLQYRCGIVNIKELNYKLMLIPIAYVLKSDETWASKSSIAKIEYWYWSSLFGGSYREKQGQRCIEDIEKLYLWLNGAENPFEVRYSRILNNEGYSNLDVLLNQVSDITIPAAIHSGILEYVLSTQPKDFFPNKDIFLNAWDIAIKKETSFTDNVTRTLKIEDHHIYPLGADLTIGQSTKKIRNNTKHILNSPLNRTYISDYSNSSIRDKLPEQYFEVLSDVTSWGHSINNTQWQKNATESLEDFHKRLLTSRYNKLLENIKIELSNLKNLREPQML